MSTNGIICVALKLARLPSHSEVVPNDKNEKTREALLARTKSAQGGGPFPLPEGKWGFG